MTRPNAQPYPSDRIEALWQATSTGVRDLDELQRWMYGTDDPPTRGNGTYRDPAIARRQAQRRTP